MYAKVEKYEVENKDVACSALRTVAVCIGVTGAWDAYLRRVCLDEVLRIKEWVGEDVVGEQGGLPDKNTVWACCM